jgi:hypothetical protein
MPEAKLAIKQLQYEQLSARIDYANRSLTIAITNDGEAITIPVSAYPELQAIMAEIGRQIPAR